MKVVGAFVTGGAILLIVIALSMETSVPTGTGRVHNLSLAAQQQNILLLGGVLLLVGVVLLITGTRTRRDRSPDTGSKRCPFCAEMIKLKAIVCRYCGRDLPVVNAPVVTDTAAQTPASTRPRPPAGTKLCWGYQHLIPKDAIVCPECQAAGGPRDS